MNTAIYYFSGTGNSLFVARELQKHISDSKLIPIAAILNRKSDKINDNIITVEDSIGFIFPCHGLTIPIPVKKFLRLLDLNSSKYIFAIVTRGGSVFHGFSAINKILNKQGKHLNASFVIDMWMNDPKLKFFSIPSNEELKAIEVNVLEKINIIKDIVANQKEYHDNIIGDTFSYNKSLNYILEKLITFTVHHIAPKVKNYFYADSKCIGCGICEKVCLSQKISMINDRPTWQKHIDCYYCYTCLNYCPTESIQIYSKFYMKSYTEEKGRYPHPYAKVKDMINQKKISSTLINQNSMYSTFDNKEKIVITNQERVN
jgi:formate hydrogenlyase subunit 6/NADH:ubiquinone oxidoreductase subunit I/flavodoxin